MNCLNRWIFAFFHHIFIIISFRIFELISFLRNDITIVKIWVMKLIKGSYHLNKVQLVKDIRIIKVIAGLRRSGKSILLDVYTSFLKLLFWVKYYY